MSHGGGDRCTVLSPPRRYLSSVSGLRATKAGFTLVGAPCGFDGGSGSRSTAIASLLDAHVLHVGDLSQHYTNEFSNAATDRAKPAVMLQFRLSR